MNRTMRRIAVAAGIIILVLAGLSVLVPRLIPTDTITARIEEEVARATGAEVTVGGARLQWRGNWRFTLTEGAIAGTGAALAAATGSSNDLESYRAVIGELNVGVSLLPLLRKRLEVGSIEISGPRLEIRWDQGEAAARGYHVRLTELNLGLGDRATAAMEADAPPGARIPEDLSLSFAVTADTLVVQGAFYTHLDLAGGFAARVLQVDALSARRVSGRINGDLSIDFAADPWGHLVFAAVISDVPAAALLEPFIPDVAARLDGNLDGDVQGECLLRDKATASRTLSVEGRLAGGPGVLHASDWLREVSPYLGDRQDLKDIVFEDLDHRFEFSQGRYHFRELALTGGDTEWTGAGWLDPGGGIALGIGVKLPAGFTPDLGNFSFLAEGLRDSDGRINLPLNLTGQASRPTVGVDLTRLRRP